MEKKIQYDLESLKKNVKDCDKNVQMFRSKIENHAKAKLALYEIMSQHNATGRKHELTKIQNAIQGHDANIDLIQKAIEEQLAHKIKLMEIIQNDGKG